MDRIFECAKSAADEAARLISKFREERSFKINYKGTRDLVTTADLAAEKVVLNCIADCFPTHAILSEESFSASPLPEVLEGPLWIIDPIDGTTNYAQGHLHVAVSIAFAVGGVVQCGVVNAPFLGEVYTAVRGKGAWLNGAPIECAKTSELSQALIATGFPYTREHLEPLIERARRILVSCRDIRRLGACALDLCWVACGRMDGYYETVMPWDMAAGALIAREAGVTVGTISDRPPEATLPVELYCEELLAAPPQLYPKLRELLSLP